MNDTPPVEVRSSAEAARSHLTANEVAERLRRSPLKRGSSQKIATPFQKEFYDVEVRSSAEAARRFVSKTPITGHVEVRSSAEAARS